MVTTHVLHFAVARIRNPLGIEGALAEAIMTAMSVFSDKLFDRVLLCACIGALDNEAEGNNKVCKTVMKSIKACSGHDAIFTTLEEVMQVWSSTMLLHLVNGCG